jgi:hypothetical protein
LIKHVLVCKNQSLTGLNHAASIACWLQSRLYVHAQPAAEAGRACQHAMLACTYERPITDGSERRAGQTERCYSRAASEPLTSQATGALEC